MDLEHIVALIVAIAAAIEFVWYRHRQHRQIRELLKITGKQKKIIEGLEYELQDLRSQLIPNRVVMTAQSAFAPEALMHDGERYAKYVMEALASDLGHNWTECIKHQLMNEVLMQLRICRSSDVASIQVRVPTIRADYDGIEVIAIDRMGRPFPLTDRSPLKRLQEEQEAAIAKAQLSSLGCIDERLVKEMLGCL